MASTPDDELFGFSGAGELYDTEVSEQRQPYADGAPQDLPT